MPSRTPRLYNALATINYPVISKPDLIVGDNDMTANELGEAIERFVSRKGNATSFVIVITCVPARHGMGK